MENPAELIDWVWNGGGVCIDATPLCSPFWSAINPSENFGHLWHILTRMIWGQKCKFVSLNSHISLRHRIQLLKFICSNAKCQIGEDTIQAKKSHRLKSQIKTPIQTQIQTDIKDNPGSWDVLVEPPHAEMPLLFMQPPLHCIAPNAKSKHLIGH